MHARRPNDSGAYGLSQSKHTNGQCRLCARPNHSLRSSMEVKCFRTNEELRKSQLLHNAYGTSDDVSSTKFSQYYNIFTRVKLFPGVCGVISPFAPALLRSHLPRTVRGRCIVGRGCPPASHAPSRAPRMRVLLSGHLTFFSRCRDTLCAAT